MPSLRELLFRRTRPSAINQPIPFVLKMPDGVELEMLGEVPGSKPPKIKVRRHEGGRVQVVLMTPQEWDKHTKEYMASVRMNPNTGAPFPSNVVPFRQGSSVMLTMGYDTYVVFKKHVKGPGDPVGHLLARRPTFQGRPSVDIENVEATADEYQRFMQLARHLLEHGTDTEKRVAEATISRSPRQHWGGQSAEASTVRAVVRRRLGSHQHLTLPPEYEFQLNELDNVVYLVLKYTISWEMRSIDLRFVLQMVGHRQVGETAEKFMRRVVMTACEYAWDHLAGEPDEFDPQMLFDHIWEHVAEWFNTAPLEERLNTKTTVHVSHPPDTDEFDN